MTADYLRRQAATCLSWARECFDLETATRLRLMADEFRAKADEIEANARFEISIGPGAAPSASAYKTGSHDP